MFAIDVKYFTSSSEASIPYLSAEEDILTGIDSGGVGGREEEDETFVSADIHAVVNNQEYKESITQQMVRECRSFVVRRRV